MPISFSIANVQVVKKPRPQPVKNGDNLKNQNTSNHSNVTTSQSNQQASAPPKPPPHQDLAHKYPGSGKLTIIKKKKGKDGESIIRRVPIYNEDYDSSDDEGIAARNQDIYVPPRLLLQTDEEILLDQLDAEITRQEEKQLLDKWNDEIMAQEEADLMKRLLINIEEAEFLERCAAMPSVVSLVEDAYEPEESLSLVSVQVPKIDSIQKLDFQPTIGDPFSPPTGIEIDKLVDFCTTRITLPRYLDQEHKILAYTRAEFFTGVIQPFEMDMLKEVDETLYGFGVRLFVSEEDPFSYVLEARGPRDVLVQLKREAEFWIQERIRMINPYLLLQDGASVVITSGVNPRLTFQEIKAEKSNYYDRVVSWTEKAFGWIEHESPKKSTFMKGWKVKVLFKAEPEKCVVTAKGTTAMLKKFEELSRNWVDSESTYAHSFESDPLQPSGRDPSIQKIRISFRLKRYVPLGYDHRYVPLPKTHVSRHYSNCGVWLSGIKDGTRLAFMMGEPSVFEKGCSLLAIDGKECNTTEDILHKYSEGRDDPKNFVMITVCVSRYTNFEAIPDLLDLNPRRLDGKPFNLSDYEKPELIVTKMMEEEQQKQQQPEDKEQSLPVEQPVNVEDQPDDHIEQPDFVTADDDDQEDEEQPDADDLDDSDNARPAVASEPKEKPIPKKKDATSTTSTDDIAKTSKPSSDSLPKRAAESVEPRIPTKKARTIPRKATITVESNLSSSMAPSVNPSQTAASNETRPGNQFEKSNAQKTKPTSHAATSLFSVAQNASGRAASHDTAPAALTERHSYQLQSPAKQKRSPATQPMGEPAGKKQKESLTEVDKNVARRASEPPTHRRNSHEQTGSTLFREHEVEFPSNQPMGAFFKTEKSKCKVFSVFKNGNAMKDGNIMPGSIAVAASIAGARKDISTHDELKEQFFRARKRHSKIHIFFVNSDVVTHPLDAHSDRDWTENGVWTGRYEGGWAGGAKTIDRAMYSKSDATQDQRHDRYSSATANQVDAGPQPPSPSDVLKDAVMNHRYTKLIEVLESGMTSDPEVIESLRNLYNGYVKGAVDEESDRERKKDLKAKQKIIRIYLDVCLYIEQAMELKNTSAFKVHVKSVEIKKRPNSFTVGRTEILSGRVSVKHGKDVEELGSLHKTPTKERISYDDFERKVFIAHGNSRLKLERGDLFIDFREGAGEDAVPVAKIGSVRISLGEIDGKCPIDRPLLIREDLKPGGASKPILSEGAVEIEFQRTKINKESIGKQRVKLTKGLNAQISFMKRFNKEFCGGKMRLRATIQSIGNATLLHAAINLQDEGMVKELMDLGADPNVNSSDYGTPVSQAMELKDRTLAKLEELISKGTSSTATEPKFKMYDMYCRILLLLKPVAQGTVDESDEDEDHSEGNSCASEEVQRKRQFQIMQEIFSQAPKEAGGLEDGLEANKNYVIGMLRLRYQKQCPDVASSKGFVADALRRKVLVSISDTKFRLVPAANSQDQDIAPEKNDAPLPELRLDWMHVNREECHFYSKKGFCKFGDKCRNVHLYRVPQDENARIILESKNLLRKEYRKKLDTPHLKTWGLNGWFTAGYHNAERSTSVYFYAEGGKGKSNEYGVNWYPKLHEAKEALQRVLTFQNLNRNQRKKILSEEKSKTRVSFSSQTIEKPRKLPVLKNKDWMIKNAREFPRCPSGTDPESIENRDFWTVEAPFGDTIVHRLKTFLEPEVENVYCLERDGFHTCAFADRQHKKIIYVEGGNSKISDQGVHWYDSEYEATEALGPVVQASRARSAASQIETNSLL